MQRLTVLAENPRRTLAALAMMLVAVAVAVGSGASFTSTSANPSNTFTAGNLQHSNSKAGTAILVTDPLVPGQSDSGTVTITNDGDVGGTFSLDDSDLVDTPGPNGGVASAKFDLLVEDVTVPASPVEVYQGKVADFASYTLDGDAGTAGVQPFAVGAAKTYKFTVTFPDGGVPASATTGDNAYKGSSLSVQYNWTAIS